MRFTKCFVKRFLLGWYKLIPLFSCTIIFLSFTACPSWELEEEIPLPYGMREIYKYLTAQPGGKSINDPVDLILDFGLPYDSRYGCADWNDILAVLANSKKYVNLDLAACSMARTRTHFRLSGYKTGRDFIVGLVLPDEATSINWENRMTAMNSRGVGRVNYTPPSLSNLKTVSGKNISAIGEYTFYCSTRLVSVDFPKVLSIGEQAFTDCRSLQNVSFPSAITIGEYVFINCYELANIDLPSVQHISQGVFYNNINRTMTITMGSVAPTLQQGLFWGPRMTSDKSVTVRVPLDATGYGTFSGDPLKITLSGDDQTLCWGNGFRGMGWDGNAFDIYNPVYFNKNISLTIVQE
jgi:hypothetical protein